MAHLVLERVPGSGIPGAAGGYLDVGDQLGPPLVEQGEEEV
jgi:hypothetical protein